MTRLVSLVKSFLYYLYSFPISLFAKEPIQLIDNILDN